MDAWMSWKLTFQLSWYVYSSFPLLPSIMSTCTIEWNGIDEKYKNRMESPVQFECTCIFTDIFIAHALFIYIFSPIYLQQNKHLSNRKVAAIMLEALQGEGGIITGDPEYFALARKLCDETGALLICDEVQVGMGRSGKLWGFENLDVIPDVFTSAKALGGGVPIGALLARGEAADVLVPGTHASTYGGNPLACSAALAVAQYMSDHDLLTNAQVRGDQLSKGLAELAEKYPSVCAESRGWGLLKGIKIKDDAGVSAGELVGDAMEEGLLIVAAGPSVVRFVPPLIVSEEEIDAALEIFERAIQKHV